MLFKNELLVINVVMMKKIIFEYCPQLKNNKKLLVF
jgi:hypothetical protein